MSLTGHRSFGYVRKENVSCYYTMKMRKSSYAGKEGQTTL